MSKKERDWLRMLERVKKKEITLRQAAEIMGGSYRQWLRKYKRFKRDGDKGLVHRGRGQLSNRAKDGRVRKAIIDRYQERYEAFGPTLAAEKLAKEGYEVDEQETTAGAMGPFAYWGLHFCRHRPLWKLVVRQVLAPISFDR